MKKTISVIFISVFALFSSYAQSNDAKANKLFVTGALKANSAIKEYENYNVKTALPLLEEALANCDKILTEYPETNIALSLVSNANLNFGVKKYSDLVSKLEKMKAFSAYVDKYGVIGELLYDSDKEQIDQAYDFFYNWREPEYKTPENPQVKAFYDTRRFKRQAILTPLPVSETQKEASSVVVENMEDVLAVSKEIKTNVALIAFEKGALPSLYEMTDDIVNKPNLMQIFEPNMQKIKDNVAKITLPDERDNAYLILSKIYANMDNSLAVNIALANIKSEDLRAQAFIYYTDKLIERGKFNNALDLLGLIKAQEIKNNIALEISRQLRDTNVDLAMSVLAQCADDVKRKDAIVEICAGILSDTNKTEIADYLSINVGDLTDTHLGVLLKRLNLAYTKGFTESSEACAKALILSELAVLFCENQKFAISLATQLLNLKSGIEDKNELVDLYRIFFDTTLYLGIDADVSPLLESISSLFSKEDLQKIYLKYAVCSSLNGVDLASVYFDRLDPKYLPKEFIIVGLLKANKSKAQVLDFLSKQ